jgi:hypothetical protein
MRQFNAEDHGTETAKTRAWLQKIPTQKDPAPLLSPKRTTKSQSVCKTFEFVLNGAGLEVCAAAVVVVAPPSQFSAILVSKPNWQENTTVSLAEGSHLNLSYLFPLGSFDS